VEQDRAVYQFQAGDIDRLCKALNCSRAGLARQLGVSRACVSQWEKGKRADAARVRQLLGEQLGAGVDVFELRKKLGMTQRVFGAQFEMSRQQVQKWEAGAAWPRRRHLEKLMKLAHVTTTPIQSVPATDVLTVSGAATYAGIDIRRDH
jgi:DNA-binding transcriptional regulator YiaG